MGIGFSRYHQARCCLCGSRRNLTREHKVKASILRATFGHETMAIGTFGPEYDPKYAQGPKSDRLKFKSPICQKCNTSRTQKADRAFDKFHEAVKASILQDNSPISILEVDSEVLNPVEISDVFRYFSKIMCCHFAESGAPRPIPVSRFAVGQINRNPIKLQIDIDPDFIRIFEATNSNQYVAHGGLGVTAAKGQLLRRFISSLTIGPVRYIFSIELTTFSLLELLLFHRNFVKKCVEAMVVQGAVPTGTPSVVGAQERL